jgi:Leucine-rich repeat (LRR) protein
MGDLLSDNPPPPHHHHHQQQQQQSTTAAEQYPPPQHDDEVQQQRNDVATVSQEEGICHTNTSVVASFNTNLNSSTMSTTSPQESSGEITTAPTEGTVEKPYSGAVRSDTTTAATATTTTTTTTTTATGHQLSNTNSSNGSGSGSGSRSTLLNKEKSSLPSRKVGSKVVPASTVASSVSFSDDVVSGGREEVTTVTTTATTTTSSSATTTMPTSPSKHSNIRGYNRASRYGRKVEAEQDSNNNHNLNDNNPYPVKSSSFESTGSAKPSSFTSSNSSESNNNCHISPTSAATTTTTTTTTTPSSSSIVLLEPPTSIISMSSRSATAVSINSTGALSTLRRQEQELWKLNKVSGRTTTGSHNGGIPSIKGDLSSNPSAANATSSSNAGTGEAVSAVPVVGSWSIYDKGATTTDPSVTNNMDLNNSFSSNMTPGAYRVTSLTGTTAGHGPAGSSTGTGTGGTGDCSDDNLYEEDLESPLHGTTDGARGYGNHQHHHRDHHEYNNNTAGDARLYGRGSTTATTTTTTTTTSTTLKQETAPEYRKNDATYVADYNGSGPLLAQPIDEADLEAEFKDRFLKEATIAEVKNFEIGDDEMMEEIKLVAAKSKRRMNCLCGLVLVLSVALVVGLGLGVGLSNGNDGEVEVPTPSPTLTPYWSLRELASPYSSDVDLDKKTSAQARAIEWLLNDDSASLLTKDDVPDWTVLERYVMAVLYYSTNGPNWTEPLQFLSGVSACEWSNVTSSDSSNEVNRVHCNNDTQIIDIRINSNNLDGTIPSELSALSNLKVLSLSYNALVGTLPTQFGSLNRLEFLQVDFNQLTGPLPNELAELVTLETLNVYDNEMTGTIPPSLLDDPIFGLKTCDLGLNQFRGRIPPIREQSPLGTLYLDFNQLTGPLPQSIFAQPGLDVIGLSGNKLNGTFGQEVAGWTSLKSAYLDANQFTGTLPSHLGMLDNLERLYLGGNALEGTIPPELSDMERLLVLDLSGNQLNGTLSPTLGSFGKLKDWSIANNKNLKGSIPTTFTEMKTLQSLTMTGTAIKDGLQGGFCTDPLLGTSIVADCAGGSPTIDCDCCTACCTPPDGNTDEDGIGSGDCTLNLTATCQIRGGRYESDTERGAVCTCTSTEEEEDGGGGGNNNNNKDVKESTILSCTDTTCESCNLEETSCVVNTDYGYHLNGTTGEVIGFENTMVYTRGKWEGMKLRYYAPITRTTCDFSVNGMKCDKCFVTVCSSDFRGFQVICDNLDGLPDPDGRILEGYSFNSCVNDMSDTGYLSILDTQTPSLLSGCSPKLEIFANPATGG